MSYKLGLYRDNGKENGNDDIIRGTYSGYIGIMEKNMETNLLLGSISGLL